MKTVRGRRNEIDFPFLLFGLRDRPGKPRSTPFCKARPGAHRADAAARFALCLANEAHLCVCARLCRGFQPSPQRRFLGGTAREACPWRDPGFLGLGFVHFCFVFAWTLDGGREREALFHGGAACPAPVSADTQCRSRWAGPRVAPTELQPHGSGPLDRGEAASAQARRPSRGPWLELLCGG